jgi:hypothetical protein
MSVTVGPKLGLPINAITDEPWDVELRRLLRALDQLPFLTVLSRILAAPPGSPANGDAYIVAGSATGAWTGHTNHIAVWTTDNPTTPGGLWEFYPPRAGWVAYSVADVNFYAYSGAAWVVLVANLVTSVAGRTGAVVIGEGDVTGLTADLGAKAAITYVDAQDATEAANRLAGDVATVVTAEAYTDAGIAAEVTARNTAIATEATARGAGDAAAVVTAEAYSDAVIATEVTNRNTAIATETTRALAAEAAILALDTLKAPLNSPALTGAPTAPTQSALDNSTKLSTTAYADLAVATEKTRALAAEANSELLAHKGVANGYASLDSSGLVPVAQLPGGGAGPFPESAITGLVADLAAKAALASPAFTGVPTTPTAAALTNNTQISSTAYTDAAVAVEKARALAAEAAIASPVTSVSGRTGAVVIAEGDVTGLVADLALLAPKASPAFTGSPTAPTQAALDNSTKIATTAYADAAVAVEVTARTTAVALKANLASPALTGVPTAPTASQGNNSTQLATTAYVDILGNLRLPFSGGILTGNLSLATALLATLTVPQNSPTFVLQGQAWASGSSVSDSWNFLNTVGAGVGGGSTLRISHSGSGTGPLLVSLDGVVNAATGFQVGAAAASGNVLRGNGTNFVSAALAEADITGLVADLALKAALASPALTGSPTAPTQTALDNSTKIATTAYADAAAALKLSLTGGNLSGNLGLVNSTAATVSVPQNSPTVALTGNYWTGSAGAADSWTFQDVIGVGTNGTSTLKLTHSAGTTGALLLDLEAPTQVLTAIDGSGCVANLYSTNAQAADMGAGIGLGGNYAGAGTPTAFLIIRGLKNNSASGDFGSYGSFQIRANGGSYVEALRLKSDASALFASTVSATQVSYGGSSSTGFAKAGVVTVLSASTVAVGASSLSAMFLLRDTVNGGTAVVIIDNSIGTPVIVSQSGVTVFVTGAPTATQMQVTWSGGVLSLKGGSSRNSVIVAYTEFSSQ